MYSFQTFFLQEKAVSILSRMRHKERMFFAKQFVNICFLEEHRMIKAMLFSAGRRKKKAIFEKG